MPTSATLPPSGSEPRTYSRSMGRAMARAAMGNAGLVWSENEKVRVGHIPYSDGQRIGCGKSVTLVTILT